MMQLNALMGQQESYYVLYDRTAGMLKVAS